MERICKRCGQVYRGLVCQQCHPRRDNQVRVSGDKAAYLMSTGCIYGPHVINGAGPHLAELRRLQPRLALVLDPNADDVRALRAACPGTVIIGRIYVPDSEVETRVRANPEGAAEWAHELTLAQPAYATGAVNYWQIANEVLQFWDGLPLLSRFEVARMRLAQGRYGCGILAFSVGQPDLPAADRLALWRQVYPALAAAEAGSHVVVVHQYGAPDLWGPAEKGGAAWLCNRLEQQVLPILPYKKVKFAVCEYGIDGLLLNEMVRSGEDAPAEPVFGVGVCVPPKDLQPRTAQTADAAAFSEPAGWQRYTDAAGYVKQLVQMGSYLEPFSSRIIGYAIFTLGHNAPWGSYDIAGEVLRRLADHYAGTPVTPPTLAQRLTLAFGAQFTDLRASLPHHATLKYETRPLSAVKQIILHHTATAQTTTWQTVANYHVNSRGWPGIAYHLGVHADGRVALLNDPETISYHAGNANGSSVAISVMGNYETDTVNAMLWQRIVDVQAVINTHLGRTLPLIGHRDAVGNSTVCPGENLYAKLKTPEVPPMATDPRAANCKAFHMDASGRVDGIELIYQPVPSARYACVKAELIDEASAQGNTVVSVSILDADGIPTAERAMMEWPYGGPPAADSPAGPGNTDNRFTTTSKYTPPAIGPLGFFVADVNKQPISDHIWGYGLPGGRHISGRVTFRERSGAVVVPPVEPGGALPEHEPVMAVGVLADKCRWWLEESIRQDEAGNAARAQAIRYSLIKRDGGLFYRLEFALKAGQPTG